MGAVYFYHTQDIQFILDRMEQGQFPAHFLYGATQLPGHGIEVIYHQSRLGLPRWRTMLRTTFQVLASRRRFDAVYATHYLNFWSSCVPSGFSANRWWYGIISQ